MPPTELVPGLALPEAHQADIQNDNFTNIESEARSVLSKKRIGILHEQAKELHEKGKLTQKQYEIIYEQLNAKWKKVE